MLIVALVLAVIGLAALVTAVVTSNELIAWVCIGASVLGVILLIIDAIRERQRGVVAESGEESEVDVIEEVPGESIDATYQTFDADYPEEPAAAVGDVVADGDVGDVEVTEIVDEVANGSGESKPASN